MTDREVTTQQCSVCGVSYPFPVELHHDEKECRDALDEESDHAEE